MNAKAFTLIELIIIITTISILAAVAFVAVNPAKRIGDTKDDKRLAEARSIKAAIEKYTVDNGSLPTRIEALDNYIPYIITNSPPEEYEWFSCSEILGDIPAVYIGTELATYLPSLPIDPDENNPDANGTGYYIRKKQDFIIEVTPCNLYANEDINSDNLVLAVRMDEDPTGGMIFNYSGHNYYVVDAAGNLTSENLIIGKVGGSFYFDGNNDFIEGGSGIQGGIFNFVTDFTVAGWIKTTDSQGGNMMITHMGPTDEPGWGLSIYGDNPYNLHAFISDGSTGGSFTSFEDGSGPSVTLNDGRWHHIAVVYDRGAYMKTFVDGQPDGEKVDISAIEGNPVGDAGVESNHWLALGKRMGGDPLFYLGNIDEVAIWNKALSEDEILSIYNLQK